MFHAKNAVKNDTAQNKGFIYIPKSADSSSLAIIPANKIPESDSPPTKKSMNEG